MCLSEESELHMAAPKRTAESEEGIARFLEVLDAHTKLLAFFFGLCFVAAALVLAICFPDPTAFQYTVFRIVLALAAAGVAGVIPGMIRLKVQPGTALLIHAGGALAVFVMVYLLAPAALTKEQPAPAQSLQHSTATVIQQSPSKKTAEPRQLAKMNVTLDSSAISKPDSLKNNSLSPSRKEKIPVSKKFQLSGIDAIENGVYILNFTPPHPVRMIRISNMDDTPINLYLIGFPQQFFYTDGNYRELIIPEHGSIEFYIVLMCNFPKDKEHLFEIQDYRGETAKITIRLNNGWEQYISKQIQEIRKKDAQGASDIELYQTAKRIISTSGYKLPHDKGYRKNFLSPTKGGNYCKEKSGESLLQETIVWKLLVSAGISNRKISSLKDRDDWKHFSTCRDGLIYYLALHPDGKWAKEARLRLRIEEAWEQEY
jgi:hypothetical protein